MSLIQFFSTAFLRAVLEFTVWYIEQQIQTTMQSMWHTMGAQAWADLDIVYCLLDDSANHYKRGQILKLPFEIHKGLFFTISGL